MVVPEYDVPVLVSVSVPLPSFVRPPVPVIAAELETLSDRLKLRSALVTIDVVASEPLVAPSPTTAAPTETVNVPVKEFAPVKVMVPAPDLVRFPLPEITPAASSVFVDATVIVLVAPVESVTPRDASSVKLSVADRVPPFINTSALVAPSPASADTAMAPAEIVVEPVKVFVPDSVSVPDPSLTRSPAPEITPENVVSDVSPDVSVPAPSTTFPAPAIDPTRSERPFTSNVAPVPTLTALVSAIRSPVEPPSRRVPPLTTVVPEYVFDPVNTSVDAPVFTIPPVPLITAG